MLISQKEKHRDNSKVTTQLQTARESKSMLDRGQQTAGSYRIKAKIKQYSSQIKAGRKSDSKTLLN